MKLSSLVNTVEVTQEHRETVGVRQLPAGWYTAEVKAVNLVPFQGRNERCWLKISPTLLIHYTDENGEEAVVINDRMDIFVREIASVEPDEDGEYDLIAWDKFNPDQHSPLLQYMSFIALNFITALGYDPTTFLNERTVEGVHGNLVRVRLNTGTYEREGREIPINTIENFTVLSDDDREGCYLVEVDGLIRVYPDEETAARAAELAAAAQNDAEEF